MIRFTCNVTVVKWLVIAVVSLVLGTFVIDETHSRAATHRRVDDARHDIAVDKFNFHVGGKRSPWFAETATLFRNRYGADLVRSSGCLWLAVPDD